MSLIAFKLTGDTASFTGGMAEALSTLERFNRASSEAQQASERMKLNAPTMGGGEGQASAQGFAQAALIGEALSSAVAPIAGIETRMTAMADRVGGTMVTLARRIDTAIKLPALEAALDHLQERMKLTEVIQRVDAFAKKMKFSFTFLTEDIYDAVKDAQGIVSKGVNGILASLFYLGGKGAQILGRVIGPVAQTVVRIQSLGMRFTGNMTRMFLNMQTKLLFAGDVARKSLLQLFAMPIVAPIRAVQNFTSAIANISPTAAKAGRAMRSFGSQVLMAFGFFGLAFKAVDFIKGALKGASDLNETANRTGLIFGDNAKVVSSAADDMAARFGVVKNDFQGVADSFGQLLQGMGGKSKAASAATSVQLARLAADASSLFNESMGEASSKMQAALRGQSEPISQYGIDVSEAATKAEALRMGLVKGNATLTTAQKVTARTSLVIKGLAVAQGDLERTSDAPANAMRRFQGTISNLATDIGSIFLPALQGGLAAANEFAGVLTTGFEMAKEGITSFAAVVADGMAAVGVIFRNLPLIWDMVVIKFAEGTTNMMAYIGTIPANLAIIADYIGNNWYQLISDAVQAVGALFHNLGTNIGNLFVAVQDFIAGKGFHFDWTPLLDGFKATAEKLPELLKPELVSMQKELDAKAAQIAKNESDRAAKMKKSQAKLAPTALETAEKPVAHELKLAGAVELGSAEARSTLLKAQGNRSNDPLKQVAKTGEKQVEIQGKILNALERNGGKPASGPPRKIVQF